jgi:hypothetical protein
MRLLKILTTGFFLLGLVLLVSWPWIVGGQPARSAPERERLAYVLRFGLYLAGTIVTFFLAALAAFFTARRARNMLREEAKENVRELIDGTLEDHAKRGQ